MTSQVLERSGLEGYGKPMGRPPAFALDTEIADKLLERIASGRSLPDVCKDEDMPGSSTVRAWLTDPRYENFREAYARAREEQADSIFNDMLDIADDARNDWMERRDKKTGDIELVPNLEHINRTRLRIDTRKWIVAKLLPKKYGELVRTEITGKDGGAIEITDNSQKLQALAQTLREAKRSAPPIEGEVIRKAIKASAPVDPPVERIEHVPEDISDLI